MDKTTPNNLYALAGGRKTVPRLPQNPSLEDLHQQVRQVRVELDKYQELLTEIHDRFNKVETRLLALTSYVAQIATILEKENLV